MQHKTKRANQSKNNVFSDFSCIIGSSTKGFLHISHVVHQGLGPRFPKSPLRCFVFSVSLSLSLSLSIHSLLYLGDGYPSWGPLSPQVADSHEFSQLSILLNIPMPMQVHSATALCCTGAIGAGLLVAAIHGPEDKPEKSEVKIYKIL